MQPDGRFPRCRAPARSSGLHETMDRDDQPVEAGSAPVRDERRDLDIQGQGDRQSIGQPANGTIDTDTSLTGG
jgi:hypothetical protein